MSHLNKITEIEAAANKAREKFTEFKKNTLKDATLSDHGKQKRIDERHETTVETLEELQQTHKKVIEEAERGLQKNAFPNPSGPDAMQFDHYVFEMSRTQITPAERMNRLEQAGSDNTRKALAKAAFIAGDYHTLEAYTKQNGDATDINKFLEFRRKYGSDRSSRAKFGEAMLFGAPSKK